MSLPEVLLWRELRKRPEGLKFRRQQVSGAYVTDFYCHAGKLVVEIDGEGHDRGNAPLWDAKRDATLEYQGVTTIRIPARDVLDNLEGTVAFIVQQASNGITPPPSSGRSPSPEGEDR